jgi:hypothetical protein
MTLQASGAISFSDLQTEFGGSNPIGMDEYYKDGSYVSSGFTGTGDASSLSTLLDQVGGRSTVFWRAAYGAGYYPYINNNDRFYSHNFWTDGEWTSGTAYLNTQFTLDQAGDYKVVLSGYNTGASRTLAIYIDGVLKTTLTSLGSSYSFTLTGSAVIQLNSTMNTIGNYNAHQADVYSSTNNRQISYTLNEDIPTSGVLSMDDFYNGQGN